MSTNMHSIETTTRSIVTDYFNWRLRNQTITNNPLLFLTRQMAYDCETRYYSKEPIFHFNLSSPLIDLQNIHHEIAQELFNNENIAWTHIITFISFSAIVAEKMIQQQSKNKDLIISSFIDWTTNSIDINLHSWLKNQNYWSGFLNIYDKTSQRRNSISRYATILSTIGMVTFGALYMNRI